MSRIVLLGEGETELQFRRVLKLFLDQRAAPGKRVGLTGFAIERRIDRLRFQVRTLLSDPEVIGVVALLDVYPDFTSAKAVRAYLQQASDDSRFYPHAAPYEIEAWLLPYWDKIRTRLSQPNLKPLGRHPEKVNGENPPSHRLDALYQKYLRRRYNKPVELQAILNGTQLTDAANVCPEFKAFLNTLCKLAEAPLIR